MIAWSVQILILIVILNRMKQMTNKESVANNSNFCDKGWHNGDCCCNCANHIEDFYHCTTVERKEGEGCVCSKHKGWICLVSFDGEKTIAHSNWAEHGFCELHVKK